MKKINITIILLLLMPLVISSIERVDAGFVLAQGNPRQTGELLPNPELIVEPQVEIGSSSPEFSYDYEVGSVDLIWTHTPGYHLSFSYDQFLPFPVCDEFARIRQSFTWTRNQTPITLKISTSFEISCTGDFLTNESASAMYSVGIWISPPYTPPYRLKTIGDLSDGETYDIEFLMSNYEAEGIFTAAGVQATYTMYIGLIPTYVFDGYYGGYYPWESFDGTVTATLYDFSVNALLDVDEIVPEKITPVSNTTTLWNETYLGLAIESIGQDSLIHLSQGYGAYPYFDGILSLGRLTSDHKSVWNQSISAVQTIGSFSDMRVEGNNVFILSVNQSVYTQYGILLIKFDSQGQEIWRNSDSLYGNDYPLLLDISSTGRIYVISLAVRYITISNPEILYNLICYDSLGERLWNVTLLTHSYEEYLYSYLTEGMHAGVSCYGSEVYASIPGEVVKLNSGGSELWRHSFNHFAFCGDPNGGFFTCSINRDDTFQLSKWNYGGDITWSRAMSIDYGPAWKDYPTMQKMEVGSDGFLYMILDYAHIDPVMTIARVSRTGQVQSHDTISLYQPDYWYYYTPFVCDLAITSDGLVHLAVSTYYSYTYNPFLIYPANLLLSYRPSAPSALTISPVSLVVTGVATLIFGGIAWDHFIRGRVKPEELLAVQEEVDPWEILMGEKKEE